MTILSLVYRLEIDYTIFILIEVNGKMRKVREMKKRMFLALVLSIFIFGCSNGRDVNLQTESSSYEIDEQIPDTYINGVTECSREEEPEL